MMKQYIVDAFTSKPFAGNPAAVCVMDSWPTEEARHRNAVVICIADWKKTTESLLAEKLLW